MDATLNLWLYPGLMRLLMEVAVHSILEGKTRYLLAIVFLETMDVERKLCHCTFAEYKMFFISFDGENIEQMTNTQHRHNWAFDMGNYHGRPFVLGGYHMKTEILTMETLEWEQMQDYPYVEEGAYG